MRVIVLTSLLKGTASAVLPYLVETQGIEVALMIWAEGSATEFPHSIRRRLRKLRRVGFLGSLNGIRIRHWYRQDLCEHLDLVSIIDQAQALGVPLELTPAVNSGNTRKAFRSVDADLAISLGNGYINREVFTIPRYGMINVHHGLTPQYRGGPSIIWEIYDGVTETGYTIHRISQHIDEGPVLYQDKLAIEFKSSLRRTVTHNYARLILSSAEGLVWTLKNFERLQSESHTQGAGRTTTTPTLYQYIQMVCQHRRLRRQAQMHERK